jgi:two-component system, CAI-1 autoinducer sensor kinase/phosphatase CqsS
MEQVSSAPMSRMSKLLRLAFRDFEYALHPTRWRIIVVACITIIGQPLYGWLWTYVYPQPYENLYVRSIFALSGVALLAQTLRSRAALAHRQGLFVLTVFLQVPLFFSWMYFMNNASDMWLATCIAGVFILFGLTDWRVSFLGCFLGPGLAYLAAWLVSGKQVLIPDEHEIAWWFAFISALAISLSSASLRRERLRSSLSVMGIMAHEMRTPLATLNLLSQALRMQLQTENIDRQALDALTHRLDRIAQTMNHTIDLQLANVSYSVSSNAQPLERVSVGDLIRTVMDDYPFNSSRERECLEIHIQGDFDVNASSITLSQVVGNLLKNSLYSLKAAQSRYQRGDLTVSVACDGQTGTISVSDKGTGVAPQHRSSIFEPFYSTSQGTGNGLGLAYCKTAVEAFGGSIKLVSPSTGGATFVISLPVFN